LLPRILKLRDQGKKLADQRLLVFDVKGLTGYVKRYQFGVAMRLWETQTLSAEVEFRKLEDQSDYQNKVEPLYYWGILALSILSFLLSINFLYLVLLQFLSQLIKDFDGLKYYWLNSFAAYTLQLDSEVDLNFLMNWLFIAFTLYAVYAAVKGNDYYGYRSSCFTFYAMT
jgi:hypothetical protein